MNTFKVIYRTTKSFGKIPLQNTSYKTTIKSLLESFNKNEIFVIIDNGDEEQIKYFDDNKFEYMITNLGNYQSYIISLNIAEKMDCDIIYFCENDHLHLPSQKEYLIDGLNYFDFITLYDHPDKYKQIYYNLNSKIFCGNLCHWRTTPSTVMTFATKKITLLKTLNILKLNKFNNNNIPLDHELFLYLGENNYTLGSCIPGRSTHLDIGGLTPLINWQSYAKYINEKN